jgi:hypothetical protein
VDEFLEVLVSILFISAKRETPIVFHAWKTLKKDDKTQALFGKYLVWK